MTSRAIAQPLITQAGLPGPTGPAGPAASFQSYTPVWTQGDPITKTVDFARYVQFGNFVFGSVRMRALSDGAANEPQTVTLPVAIASTYIQTAGSYGIWPMTIGNAIFTYDYADDYFTWLVVPDSSTTVRFLLNTASYTDDSGDQYGNWTQDYSLGLTSLNTDKVQYSTEPAVQSVITFNFMYEATST